MTGFSFGTTASTGVTQPANTGLFGASTQPSPANTGLFGQPATTTAGLFGQTPANTGFSLAKPTAPTTTAGLFGASAPPANTGLFGSNAPPANTTGLNSAVTGNAQLTGKSKYSDLPEAFKTQVNDIDKFIHQQVQTADSMTYTSFEETMQTIRLDSDSLTQRLAGVRNLLQRDLHVLDDLKKLVNGELRNSDLAARYLDHRQHSTTTKRDEANAPTNTSGTKFQSPSSDAYAAYFTSFTNDLERRMQNYRQNIEEIESNVKNMMSASIQYTPQVIQEILRNQHQAFLTVANKVAHIHDDIEQQKQQFGRFKRTYLGNDANSLYSSDQMRLTEASLSTIAHATLKPSNATPNALQTNTNANSTTSMPPFGFNKPAAATTLAAPTGSLFQTPASATGGLFPSIKRAR